MATPSSTATPKRTQALSATVFSEINDLAFFGPIYGVSMLYSPKAWVKASASSKRTWVGVDFPPEPLSLIPNQPGVYIFFVVPEIFGLPQASGLLYVGKATKLRARISSYLSEIDSQFSKTSRPSVWRMLNVWHGYLRYFYTVTKDVAEAETLEQEMLAALIPPANKQYPATISKSMKAFK